MSERVYNIFSQVYRNYDAVNTICSLGTIVQWRKVGAQAALVDKEHYKLLDIATGTGEFAIALYREARRNGKHVDITAMDFAENMLMVAVQKAQHKHIKINFEHGDAMHLRYANNSFDVVTSSFALRNVDDLAKFSKEAYRVLKKGGKFVFMDMARPDNAASRAFLKAFWVATSGVGNLSENKDAFKWLMESIERFDKRKFVRILRKAKFKGIRMRNLRSGAAFMVTGHK